MKGDVSYSSGIHTVKVGGQFMQTRLDEQFGLGITDPTFNPVCLTANGDPVTTPSLVDPDACARAGYQPNPDLQPGLGPDRSDSRGQPFQFQ